MLLKLQKKKLQEQLARSHNRFIKRVLKKGKQAGPAHYGLPFLQKRPIIKKKKKKDIIEKNKK